MAGVKKLKKKSHLGRILLLLVLVAVIAAGAAVLGPRLVHHCSNCGKLFAGTGYEANVVTNTIGQLTGQDEKILCADCAAKDHAIALAAGKSLSDFKRPLFPPKAKSASADK